MSLHGCYIIGHDFSPYIFTCLHMAESSARDVIDNLNKGNSFTVGTVSRRTVEFMAVKLT
jgi:hypothetical protein